ncbi:acyltransferase family protein [Luteimonas composti]|uniref:Acyltransferase family protein n=1 Tax=Luteimonas composti TaxID=398257 RepID=A0ABT6MTY6_9GAMM|nr:acyltransferase family protein [Luteimonas composti]MDH7454065.1 acyltransferase family protein [Luteimonas composti]
MVNARGVSNYHPAVDGLRAIAVLSVVLYHGGLSWLSGGYVGVDVFFVISGFLIIGHIVEQRTRGTFRYREFWARRVVRILPPYLLVVATTLLASLYFLVTSDEFKAVGEQAMYSGMMLVNHHFLSLEGYFDTAAESKPLLHLWSLSVEEQFYLVTPLLVGLFWMVARPGRIRVVAGWLLGTAVLAGSLYVCVRYTSGGEKNYAFYLMPLRAWEFVIGGMTYAALPWLRRLPSRLVAALGWVGLAAVLAAVFGFSHQTSFPSYNAALPVVGAALLIGAGVVAPQMGTARLLSVKPMVWIGLLSYSWYLWHWPAIVFTRIYNFDQLPLALGMVAVVGSLGLAYLTYRWLETPARIHWQPLTRVAGLRVIAAGLLACAAIVAAGALVSRTVAKSAAEKVPAAYWRGKGSKGGACSLHSFKKAACDRHMRSAVGGKPRQVGVLLGDSHARAMRAVLVRRAAMEHDTYLATYFRAGCNPMRGVVRHWVGKTATDTTCRKQKRKAWQVLEDGKLAPDFAIVSAFWSNYPTISSNRRSIPENQAELYIRSLRRTLDDLQKVGAKRILVIGAVPVMAVENPTACVMRAQRYRKDVAKVCGSGQYDYERRSADYVRRLELAIGNRPNVRLIDPRNALCYEGVCSPLQDGVIVYRDDDHVNDFGAMRIYKVFRKDFEWVFGVETGE